MLIHARSVVEGRLAIERLKLVPPERPRASLHARAEITVTNDTSPVDTPAGCEREATFRHILCSQAVRQTRI
jgi:hypothetical protein